MFGIPLWAYLIASAFYGVWYWRRLKVRRAGQIVSAVEGRHRPVRGGGL